MHSPARPCYNRCKGCDFVTQELNIRLNGVATDMLPSHVYLIPPHRRHDMWCDTRVEKVYIDVHAELRPAMTSSPIRIRCSGCIPGWKSAAGCAAFAEAASGKAWRRGEILLLLTVLMPQEPEVVSARMAEALLLTGETLQLLTDEYGFCDGYYLSACFKRYMDVSPLKYRALHQIS